MTTPYQSSPDGAIVVGGGEYKYSQAVNEAAIRSMFEMENPTPANMIDLLRMALERLPIEGLQPFATFLGAVDDIFDNIGDAVNSIVSSLVARVFQTVADFNTFLTTLFTNPGSLIGNLFNVVMDGIHSIGDFLKKLWDGLTGNTGTTATKTVENVATAASGVKTTLGTTTTTADSARDNLQITWNDLYDGLGGTTGSTGRTAADVRGRGATVRTAAITGEAVFNSGSNMLINPSFESLSFAVLNNGVRSTDVARTGTQSLKLTANGSTYPFSYLAATPTAQVYLPCVPTEVIYLEAWVYGKATNTLAANTANGITMGITSYDTAKGSAVNTSVSFPVGTQLNGTWTKISGQVTVPASKAFFTPYIQINSAVVTGTTETFYFDDVVVREVTLPAAAQTTANTATTNVQSTVDNIHQSVNGGTATGNSVASVKTNLALANAKIYDGLAGTTGSTSKLPSEIATAADTVRSNANTGVTNAATADAKAVTSQETANDSTAVGLANTADILTLKTAQLGGSNSGYSATDTFNTVGSTLSSSWNMSISGVGGRMGTDGTDAYWINGSTTTGTTTETDYWTTPTNGDYQLVTMVLGTRNVYNSINMFARMDAARSNYIGLTMTSTTLRLFKVVAGVSTTLGGTYTIPGSQSWKTGDVIQLIAGTAGNVRQFQVKRGGLVIIDQTDTAATLSVVGASNRFAGMGMTVTQSSGQIYQPGKIAAWSVADNQPPAVVGSGFRAYRTSLGTSAMSSGNNQRMPASWFNSGTEYCSPDITYNVAQNRATFSIEGWYQVTVNLYGTGGIGIGGGGDVAAAIYKNGATGSTLAGTSITGNINVGFQSPPNASLLMYLQAGDYLEPGWTSAAWSGGGNFWTGDATGVRCWWAAALVNRSLL